MLDNILQTGLKGGADSNVKGGGVADGKRMVNVKKKLFFSLCGHFTKCWFGGWGTTFLKG